MILVRPKSRYQLLFWMGIIKQRMSSIRLSAEPRHLIETTTRLQQIFANTPKTKKIAIDAHA